MYVDIVISNIFYLNKHFFFSFSIGSALWVLEVLCCLYWHSFCQIDHSTLWWMVVGVNWLMLFQELPQGSVLGPLLLILFTSELFSILENKLIGYAAIPRRKSYSSGVHDPWPWQC